MTTPSRRADRPIRRWVRIVGDDHPRACTGRRLLRLGLAATATAQRTGSPVVLDPYAPQPLSRADRPTAERYGILAIDCSWNRLSLRGGFSEAEGDAAPRHRRLPFLIATNPQHYGRLGELNTAEALGAALFLLGHPKEAAGLLEGFAGGPAFLDINRDRLDRFARAVDGDATLRIERAIYSGGA